MSIYLRIGVKPGNAWVTIFRQFTPCGLVEHDAYGGNDSAPLSIFS